MSDDEKEPHEHEDEDDLEEEIKNEKETNYEELAIYNKILMGAFDESIPETKRKLVRIFTSSTFTDTLVERNMLMEKVYPRLKTYCKEYHNLEFQVVDMRWGIRDESTDEHKTVDLCMTEIERCQQLSLGPNFVTFLCQKYGFRPLQIRIIDTEFNMFCEVSSQEDAEFLKKWYWLDENSLPPQYILQKISTYHKNYCNKADRTLMEQDQALWYNKTMPHLTTIIRTAARKLLEQKRFNNEDNHRYNFSVTEQEVIKGVFGVRNNTEHVIAFIRNINNINIPMLNHSTKFIDINFADGKIDKEAVDMLADLRDRRLHAALDKDSIVTSKIEWSDNNGINVFDHANYLLKFGETFYSRVVALIEQAINKLMKITNNK